MSTPIGTPKEQRAKRRAETARFLRRVADHHDVSIPRMAIDSGIDDRYLRRQLDPETGDAHPLCELVMWTPEAQVDILEHFAKKVGRSLIVPATAAPAASDVLELVGVLADTGGRALHVTLTAAKDSHISADEALLIVEAAEKAEAAMRQVKELALVALRERGLTLDGGRNK